MLLSFTPGEQLVEQAAVNALHSSWCFGCGLRHRLVTKQPSQPVELTRAACLNHCCCLNQVLGGLADPGLQKCALEQHSEI